MKTVTSRGTHIPLSSVMGSTYTYVYCAQLKSINSSNQGSDKIMKTVTSRGTHIPLSSVMGSTYTYVYCAQLKSINSSNQGLEGENNN